MQMRNEYCYQINAGLKESQTASLTSNSLPKAVIGNLVSTAFVAIELAV